MRRTAITLLAALCLLGLGALFTPSGVAAYSEAC